MTTARTTKEAPLLDLVQRFAFPRYPGTAGETRAADLFASELSAAGLPVHREPFVASAFAIVRIRALLHAAAAALVVVMCVAPFPAISALAAASLLVLVARAGSWPRFLETWFNAPPHVTSENVMAQLPAGQIPAAQLPTPQIPAAASSRTAPRVVLLAHLDSKSSRFPTFVPVALILAATLGIAFLGAWFALAAFGFAGAPNAPTASVRLIAGAAIVAALAVALVNPSGNESPGAMDNASGLAVLVAAARAIAQERAPYPPTLFLATGAEEIGLAGALRWIQSHAHELKPAQTIFVNIDSVGVGRGLFALDVHGRAPDGRSMREIVRAAAQKSRVAVDVLSVLPGVGVDTMPIAARGYSTVTILGRVLGSASRRIHSKRDRVDALREEALQDALRVVLAIVREAQVENA